MSDTPLPCFDDVAAMMAAAEEGDGWLATCEAQGWFLVLNREFVRVLADQLRLLNGPILETCAGHGELAEALVGEGIEMIATDATPPPGSAVVRADAREALARYTPATVIGSFVPFDSGADEAVLAAPSVAHYLVLNARLGGQLGSAALWRNTGWIAAPLPAITRWMICRHDLWLGPQRPPVRHGEAWLFRRQDAKAHG
jgi:hypothetical protein